MDYDKSTDDFLRRLSRQVREDHAGIRERNAKREAVWRQSPAMRMASELLQGPFGHEPVGEDEHGIMLLRAQEALAREPLVQRYLNHLEFTGRGVHNTDWWHALGAQYMAAIHTARATSLDEYHRRGRPAKGNIPVVIDARLYRPGEPPRVADLGPNEFLYESMGRVMRGMTYLWHQNTIDAATAAPLVPHVFQPNALPFADLFFCFERPIFVEPANQPLVKLETEDGVEMPCVSETSWVHITRMGDAGAALIFDRYLIPQDREYMPQAHIMFEPIRWGARWPEDFEGFDSYNVISAILRMLAFMQAPFVDTTSLERRLPRPIRREYERAGKEAPLKEVSVITLRARLYEPVFNGREDGEGPGREYKHSWWVNGHYRWQWYPSTKEHKLIPIAQYMKQIGKPLLPQIRDVSR
jgi:hypothetical protein